MFRFDAGIGQGFFYVIKSFGRRYDFEFFAFGLDVVGACFEGYFHDLVFVGVFLAYDEDALALEHPAYAACFAEAVAVFGEYVADFGGRAVAVIREDVDRYCNAGRAVAFVRNFFVVLAFCSAGAFLDRPLNIIFRNVVFFCFLESQFQAHVADRVRAAHTDGDGNFTADFRGDFAADGVVLAFFTLNICPFRMSRHSVFLLLLPPRFAGQTV